MAGISLKGRVASDVELKTIGKKSTPLAKFTIAEPIRKKEGKKWVTEGHNHFEVQVWGDKAVEASMLSVNDEIDASSYVDDSGDFIRHRAKVDEESWSWKGKEYSKLSVTLFDWDVVDEDDD